MTNMAKKYFEPDIRIPLRLDLNPTVVENLFSTKDVLVGWCDSIGL